MSVERIRELLNPLLEKEREYGEDREPIPATETEIEKFRAEAKRRGVPEEVIEQLAEYYRVSKGEEYFDGYWMSEWDDVLFEWWDDYRKLWLGGRDDDVYQWQDGKFFVAPPGCGPDYAFHVCSTLVELLEKITEEIQEAWNYNEEDDADED